MAGKKEGVFKIKLIFSGSTFWSNHCQKWVKCICQHVVWPNLPDETELSQVSQDSSLCNFKSFLQMFNRITIWAPGEPFENSLRLFSFFLRDFSWMLWVIFLLEDRLPVSEVEHLRSGRQLCHWVEKWEKNNTLKYEFIHVLLLLLKFISILTIWHKHFYMVKMN